MQVFNAKMMLRVVISALAAYRVSRMLALESGPFNWFGKWRGAMITRWPKSKLVAEGVSCPLCLGVYVAALMLALTYVKFAVWGVVWLAVAGLQTVFQAMER